MKPEMNLVKRLMMALLKDMALEAPPFLGRIHTFMKLQALHRLDLKQVVYSQV